MVATLAAGTVALMAKAVQYTPFERAFAGIGNPWALRSISGPVEIGAGFGISLTMLGLVVAAASLVVRFRRAVASGRRQLRWMALIAVLLPALVVASYVAAYSDVPLARTIATGGCVALIPIAAGLSVQRYRLYDVDRILGRVTGYVLSSSV